jgi:hypothetical protein
MQVPLGSWESDPAARRCDIAHITSEDERKQKGQEKNPEEHHCQRFLRWITVLKRRFNAFYPTVEKYGAEASWLVVSLRVPQRV